MPEVAEVVNPAMTDETTHTRRFITALRTEAWLWLVPALIGLGAATIWSARAPVLYRSSTLITVAPPKVPTINAAALDLAPSMVARLPEYRNDMLRGPLLERIITNDLYLNTAERRTRRMEELIETMRARIGVVVEGPSVTVSFAADDPRLARRVVERLSAHLMDEAIRDQKLRVENTDQFLEGRLEDMRTMLVKAEANLALARRRTSPDGSLLPEVLELEVVKTAYQKLLQQQHESQTAVQIERRQLGETFQLVDAARVSTVPIGPVRVKLAATVAGLAIGLLLVGSSSRKSERGPSAPAAPTHPEASSRA